MTENIVSNKTYQHDFENYLLFAKGGLILYLLIQTIVYQMRTKERKFTNTYFSDQSYMLSFIGAVSAGAFIATLTTAYILGSRSIMSMHILLIVFAILFMYDIFQETSGVNAWLSSEDTAKGIGPYAHLNNIDANDTTLHKSVSDSLSQHNDYERSAFYAYSITTALILLYLFGGMAYASYKGYQSGENNIYDATFWNGINPALGFFLEIIFMMANGAIPIIATKIKGENLTTAVYMNSVAFGLGSVILHTMFQYVGLYKSSHPAK